MDVFSESLSSLLKSVLDLLDSFLVDFLDSAFSSIGTFFLSSFLDFVWFSASSGFSPLDLLDDDSVILASSWKQGTGSKNQH